MSVSGLNATTSLSPLSFLSANAAAVQAQAQAATAKATSTTSGSGLDGSTTGTTFLNLLVKELQNQDPTAPMDSTAMVGQMISLNQLDQLISINQVLGAATSSTSGTSTGETAGSDSVSSSALMAERAALMNSASPSNSINAATLAASDPSSTLDFSTLNTQFGAK